MPYENPHSELSLWGVFFILSVGIFLSGLFFGHFLWRADASEIYTLRKYCDYCEGSSCTPCDAIDTNK